MTEDPLGVERETMRELGYRTVDMLVDWLGDASAPPLRRASPADMRARLGGPPPDSPEPFERILEQLVHDVLPFASRVHHPRFFAFIPGSGTWPDRLTDQPSRSSYDLEVFSQTRRTMSSKLLGRTL